MERPPPPLMELELGLADEEEKFDDCRVEAEGDWRVDADGDDCRVDAEGPLPALFDGELAGRVEADGPAPPARFPVPFP